MTVVDNVGLNVCRASRRRIKTHDRLTPKKYEDFLVFVNEWPIIDRHPLYRVGFTYRDLYERVKLFEAGEVVVVNKSLKDYGADA